MDLERFEEVNDAPERNRTRFEEVLLQCLPTLKITSGESDNQVELWRLGNEGPMPTSERPIHKLVVLTMISGAIPADGFPPDFDQFGQRIDSNFVIKDATPLSLILTGIFEGRNFHIRLNRSDERR